MSDFNTKLMTTLFKGESVDEIMRVELESAFNELLRNELTVFLDYEKHDPIGYNTGNSRNGIYERKLKTRFGEISVEIPRDRNGEFKQQSIPSYQRSTDDLEAMVIQMYRKGITTAEIADLIEKMYGAHYTPQTVSNMTKMVQEQVLRFHQRPLNPRYAVIYCDATYLAVRRDSVAKEALHILLGITPEGNKEVLDYRLYPSESSENYREMLQDIRSRGVEDVLLFVSDGLIGLREVCVTSFPHSRHQSCWVHISRNVSRLVRPKDKAEILGELKKVYRAANQLNAQTAMESFLIRVQGRYPKVVTLLQSNQSLYTFYAFPEEIRSSIYTTNSIEGLNKQLKRDTKRKEQFPNEEALDRFVCVKFLEFNQRFTVRVHKGFGSVSSRIDELFTN